MTFVETVEDDAAIVDSETLAESLSQNWASERTGRSRVFDSKRAARRRMKAARTARTPRNSRKQRLSTSSK
eukprot:CAMPEP_0185835710 /NCGR_PEP_ID=MMETSP1353-20130828/8279_1 /TAXON_ID=1077150 /ORGANISM="Erythrolobus australicus, Strain CCMP3124" /LENGTH=70 /DNA_ID=CAMNT_0028534379 /DNA_START=374 /DNA_END=586 /DNA_ORIENTATION=-